MCRCLFATLICRARCVDFAALGFRGANVTVPHKAAVMRSLDTIDEAARAIGAVNTIRVDPETGTLHGFNTDMIGFLTDLAAHGVLLHHDSHALILGAGGAARACAAGLLRSGAAVTLVNRSATCAEALHRDFELFAALNRLRTIGWVSTPKCHRRWCDADRQRDADRHVAGCG